MSRLTLENGNEQMLKYEKRQKLGEGTYGTVWLVVEKGTNQNWAMKILPLDQEEEGIPFTTMREASILKKITHNNVIPIKEFFFRESSFVMVLKFMPYDLRKVARSRRRLKPDLIQSYAYQILAGLYHLHTHRVIHRDIKPENILLDKDGNLQICDFGLSHYFTLPVRHMSDGVVTIWYRPPEILLGNPEYDVAVDIWSAGCVIAEMTTGAPLFMGDSPLDMLHKIIRVLGTPPPEILAQFHDIADNTVKLPEIPPLDLSQLISSDNPNLVDLLTRMLSFSPINRITAKEAMSHPYFDTLSPKIRERCQ